MRNKKRTTAILAGIMAGIMLLSLLGGLLTTMVSAAPSSSSIRKEIDELEEEKAKIDAEIAGLEDQIADNMDEMEQIVAQKDLIDRQVFLLNEERTNLNAQITAYGQLVADKQDELDAAQKRLTDLNEKNRERIRAMEKNGEVSYWSVLFQATDFMDLLDRVRMIFQINQADQECLQELNEAADEVTEVKKSLESEMAALQASRDELAANEEELNGKRAEADKLLSQLVARGAEYEELVQEAEEESDAMIRDILQKQKEFDAAKKEEERQAFLEWKRQEEERRRQEEAAKNPGGSGSSGGSGAGHSSGNTGNLGGSGTAGTPRTVDGITWLMPITYFHFTSPFGMRLHPIYHTWKLHAGVDLSAPAMTPIYASRDGQVSIAKGGGSGGNWVMVNHFDGYSTAYMHMTYYTVKVGQNVKAGDLLGYCGSTGAATGPHLHFAVYYNGVAVNPADYIAI